MNITRTDLEKFTPMPTTSNLVNLRSGYAAPTEHGSVHSRIAQHSIGLSTRRMLNAAVIGACDMFALSTALCAGGLLRHALYGASVLPNWVFLMIPAWLIGAGVLGLIPGWGLSAVDHLRRQAGLMTALFCGGAVLMFFTRSGGNVSRLSWGIAWGLSMVLVPLARTVGRHMLCKRNLFGLPTIVFGRADQASTVVERLRTDVSLGYVPYGICTDDPGWEVSGVKVLGSLDETQTLAPAAIIVSQGLSAEQNRAIIGRVLNAYRNVMILPDMGDVPSLFISPRDLSGTVGLEISQALLSPFASKLKRACDLLAVTVTAPIWGSLCGLILTAIWLEDRHTPLFKQKRIGRNEKTFNTYKCRTMVPHAEEVLKRRLAEDPALNAEWNRDFKLRNDPRITRVGRVLRKTSLDELPQLFNVLRGDMALVGPRPLPAYHLDELGVTVRNLRARMRPGVTGLWQVSGRSNSGNDGMRRWDHYYVRNWSMWLDIIILVRTFRVVLLGSGAR